MNTETHLPLRDNHMQIFGQLCIDKRVLDKAPATGHERGSFRHVIMQHAPLGRRDSFGQSLAYHRSVTCNFLPHIVQSADQSIMFNYETRVVKVTRSKKVTGLMKSYEGYPPEYDLPIASQCHTDASINKHTTIFQQGEGIVSFLQFPFIPPVQYLQITIDFQIYPHCSSVARI